MNPTPESTAAAILRFLQTHHDPERAASGQRFFKEPVPQYGVRLPEVRQFIRQLVRERRSSWTAAEAADVCQCLVVKSEVEAQCAGFFLLGHFRKSLTPDLLPRVRSWAEKHCENWAVIDALCPEVLSPLVAAFPELAPKIVGWHSDPCLWVRRCAIVTFVSHARHGRFLDEGYTAARALLPDDEDLIHKAVGWYLREAGKSDRPRLDAFLRRHGPTIPRTSVRYAIERHPEAERQQLLAETRG